MVAAAYSDVVARLDRAIQYAVASRFHERFVWDAGSPAFAREFEKRGREPKVRVDGQFVFNSIALRLNAVLAGLRLAYLPDQVQSHLAEGKLIRVLEDWCAPFLAIFSTIQAASNRRQCSPCSSMRCATGVDAQVLALEHDGF
jgi:DNA-binding transcriptional LysR family regulator